MRCVAALLMLFFSLAFGQTQPYLHLNKIIAKLEAGRIVCGIWASGLHPTNAIGIVETNGYPSMQESMTKPMIDFLLIDMEHQPFDVSGLRNFLLALNSKRDVIVKGNLQPNLATLVRIPAEGDQPNHAMIKQVLDIGGHGVVVPHIRNSQEARQVVQACRYPQPKDSPWPDPPGTRGASPWLCAYLWGLTLQEYIERADVWPLNPQGDLLVVLMIEDEEGVGHIEDILQVKGVGAIIFGPYDYSFAIGKAGQPNHPEVLAAWDKVKGACDKHKVPLIGFANAGDIKEKLNQSYHMLLIGHDVRNNSDIPTILETLRKEQP